MYSWYYLITSGMLSILFFNSAVSGLLRITAGLILFPPTLAIIEKVAKTTFNRVVKYVAIVILFQVSIIISFYDLTNSVKVDSASKSPEKIELTKDASSIDSLTDLADKRVEFVKKENAEFREKFLNGWDGSFAPLVIVVKETMDDPDSFEHIETNAWVTNDYITVVMRFRGKNAFGGKVVNVVKAKASFEGKLIAILPAND